jgi:hypothetical protein
MKQMLFQGAAGNEVIVQISCLGTMCSGDDQGELDRRTIPAASSERNSASAILSLSGSRRRALANTGRPVVSTKWLTPWRGRGVPLPSPTMLGNDARSERTASTMCEIDAANLDEAAMVQPTGCRDDANSTALENGSTNRR